jgi:hypothetical protein
MGAGLMLYVLIMLLIGCAAEVTPSLDVEYERSRRATIEAWEKVIGRVSDECYDYTLAYFVEEVGYIENGKNYKTVARTITNHDGIYMILLLDSESETDKADHLVHEYIHILSLCEMDNWDKLHLDARYWIEYGRNTVEAQGCARL